MSRASITSPHTNASVAVGIPVNHTPHDRRHSPHPGSPAASDSSRHPRNRYRAPRDSAPSFHISGGLLVRSGPSILATTSPRPIRPPMPSNAPDPTRSAFARLRVWERDGERAPHKPLLALLALGRWAANQWGPLRYADIESPLRDLLAEFGPPRKSHHPEFPFWYLRNDGVWEVVPDQGYPPRKGHSSPSAKQLREHDATGQFTPAVRAALAKNPALVPTIARDLLDAHFPPSLHEDIAAAEGLDLEAPFPTKTVRDPAFRDAVLLAYGYACAVCRVGVRLGHTPVGVEAAHIRWHSYAGPDTVPNGLCLCSLHHKLFDRGALTLSADGGRVLVSEAANGVNVHEALGRHHDTPLASPGRADCRPDPAFVAWHRREVFRDRPRD